MAYQKRTPRKALKDMTPAEQLKTQIARVEKLGLRVVGHGTLKADGTRFWIVPSTSEKLKNMHHVVRQTGKGLVCDCYACTESGLICPHRATVYLELKRQAEAAKATPAAQPTQSAPKPQPTMAQRAAAALPADPGEFSIYR
jgi:hypothetical protein